MMEERERDRLGGDTHLFIRREGERKDEVFDVVWSNEVWDTRFIFPGYRRSCDSFFFNE